MLFKAGATCTFTNSETKQTNFIITCGADLSLEMYNLCIAHLHQFEKPDWEAVAVSMFFNRDKFKLAYDHAKRTDRYPVANRLLKLAIEKDAADACTILFPDSWHSPNDGCSPKIEVSYDDDTYFRKGACRYDHTPYSYAIQCGSLRALQALVDFNLHGINSKIAVFSNGSHHLGDMSLVAMVVNENNLQLLAIVLSNYHISPNLFCSSPPGLNVSNAFKIALKRGYHQAAQMLILHPNFTNDIHPDDLASYDVQQHTALLKARDLSNKARKALLNEKTLKDSQRLFQEAL
ncbi:MAG: hypothetical protein M3R00_05005, partial [Pseudomonadota bacterium]|nr:hypothetical protein [Pseudomonadota bacterium]